MGAWSVSAFGNDVAQDFLFDYRELDSGDRLGFLRGVLIDCASESELPASVGERGVAAAAIVAQLSGCADSLVNDIEGSSDPAQFRGLIAEAIRALEVVVGPDSELRELWEDAGEDEWFDVVEKLRDALAHCSN